MRATAENALVAVLALTMCAGTAWAVPYAGGSADLETTVTVSGTWSSVNWYESDGCYSGVGDPEVSDWDSQAQGGTPIDLSTSASDTNGSASSSITVAAGPPPTIDVDSGADVYDVSLPAGHWAMGYSEGGANWLTSGATQTVDVTVDYSYDLNLTMADPDSPSAYVKIYVGFWDPGSNLMLTPDAEFVQEGNYLVKTVSLGTAGTSSGPVTGSKTWQVGVNSGAFYSFWSMGEAFVWTVGGEVDPPAEVWVDDDYDSSTPGWGTTHFASIQDGIDAAAVGGIVHVAAGTYQEDLASWKDMEITQSLSLVGAGSGSTVVELTEGKMNGVEIRGSGMEVLVEGITFTREAGSTHAAGFNLRIAETASSFSSLVLRDVEVAYAAGRNVFLGGSTTYDSIVVENCSFHHSGVWGFSARGTIVDMTITNSDFEYNGLDDAEHGIGFDIDMPISVASLQVEGGSFSYNTSKGINLVNTNNATFTGVTASDNSGSPAGGFGVSLWEWVGSSSNLTFTACTMADNSSDGVLFGTEGTTSLNDVAIQNCFINGNGRAGVLFYHDYGGSVSDISITNCDLSGNGWWGAIPTSALGTMIDASGNWYGETAPSAVGGLVGSNVDYTPWLADGGDTSGDAGFQGDFSELWVDDDSPQSGTEGRIQEGIGMASGSTVNVAAGTYDETLDIDSKSGLTIQGADKTTVIFKPASTINWDTPSYGTRQTAIRVIDSTDIAFYDMTLDFDDLYKNDWVWVSGLMGWDSTVTVDNCIIQNMSGDDTLYAYRELASYFLAPGFTEADPADIIFTNDDFINAGRVAIVTHGWINATISNNTFTKTIDDFGYAVELGSTSGGTISNNTIYGYDTPAAYDDSASGGLYIESCLYYVPGSPSGTKSVTVTGNEVYDCQNGMFIGNTFDAYAGDVDIVMTVSNNDFHDNDDRGVIVGDEGREDGSSVTVAFVNNTVTDNGNYGYDIYTKGDGDITATFTGEEITGHDVAIGVREDLPDPPPPGSWYDITVTSCNLSGNTTYAVENTYSGTTVNASGNWFGVNDPATVAGLMDGPVDYTPWLDVGTDTSTDPGFQGDFSELWVDDDSQQTGPKGRIEEALDLVTASIVNVAPGTYGSTVIFDDATLDGIVLQGSDPANRSELQGGVLFDNDTDPLDGITLRNLVLKGNADPTADESIVSMRNGAAVNDLAMDNCLLDGEGVAVGADGADGRFGVQGNKLGGTLTVTDCEFKNIPGWSVMDIDTSYPGPPYGGNEFPLSTVTFTGNSIHDCNGTVALRGNHVDRTNTVSVYGNSWTNIGGNFSQAGMAWAAIEINHADEVDFHHNIIDDVAEGVYGEGQAVQLWDVGTLSMCNNGLTNCFQGVFVFGGSAGGSYGGPWSIPGGSVHHNVVSGNTQYGVSVDSTATAGPLDAEYNWWGNASGPYDPDDDGGETTEVPPCTGDATSERNADGTGNAVLDDSVAAVDYCPRLATTTTVTLNPDETCYDAGVGDTITITIDLSDVAGPYSIVGGQFFLSYDDAVLLFISAAPGDAPFTREVYGQHPGDDGAGTLDYAVGTPDGMAGTTDDTTMAVLTFEALAEVCDVDELVEFRSHTPPSRLSDEYGGAVNPQFVHLEAITIDGTPPNITCPDDITVNANAGSCTASVVLPPPASLTDNCDPTPTHTYWIGSTEIFSPHTFPGGSTTVTIKAQDACGNESSCNFDVTVSGDNEMLVNVQLSPTLVPGTITRCITFELWGGCPHDAPPDAVVSQEVTFTGGVANAVPVLVPCDTGPYACITARDALHTLRRTDEGFHISGTQYVADFTGDPGSGGDWLIGGNLNDDYWIDILDFGVFSYQWNENYGTGDTTCSTPYPHADINGDGIVTSGDFTFIQINFLESHEPNCCSAPGFREGGEGGEGPVTEISVAELIERGLGHLAAADLNRDGWLDVEDVEAFMAGVRPRQPVPSDTVDVEKVPAIPQRLP